MIGHPLFYMNVFCEDSDSAIYSTIKQSRYEETYVQTQIEFEEIHQQHPTEPPPPIDSISHILGTFWS